MSLNGACKFHEASVAKQWPCHGQRSCADLHQRHTGKGFKGKIHPPRLNGGRRGALATRTPHRPNPLGLSLCRIISVSDGCLVLGGADLVDKTPVLDIKPYVPFCEALADSSAPTWVSVRSSCRALALSVSIA